MTTTDRATARPTTDGQRPWIRLLVWATAASAAADVAVMALLGAVIPPVAAGVVISAVGITLVGRRPHAGIGLIFAVSAVLVATGAPFALPHLSHPESAVDFGHAVVHLGGRLVAILAAVGAWWSSSPVIARRLGRAAAALLLATAVVAVAATLTAGDPPSVGDARIAVGDFAFPSEVRVASGSTVFVRNSDLTRHTFTVVGTHLSAELPAGKGARFSLHLPPGTYRVICAVPGHDSMKATLIVE